jgi:hypothetical protein
MLVVVVVIDRPVGYAIEEFAIEIRLPPEYAVHASHWIAVNEYQETRHGPDTFVVPVAARSYGLLPLDGTIP